MVDYSRRGISQRAPFGGPIFVAIAVVRMDHDFHRDHAARLIVLFQLP